MRIWPVILDSTPRPFGRDGSLLLFPLGTQTVLERLRHRLEPFTRFRPVIVAGSKPCPYVDRVQAVWPGATVVTTPEHLMEAVAACELSDALLIVDPRHLPRRGADLSTLVRQAAQEPRAAHHLIAFEAAPGGTRERVSFDTSGRIRRIDRHYERATWPFIAGVAATLLPVSSGILADGLLPASLEELRHTLTLGGIPGRDVPAGRGAWDLSTELGLLAAVEFFVRKDAAARGAAARAAAIFVGDRHSVDETARITGPVVIHEGAKIEAHALICGPAVIGAEASVAQGAVVAHAVLGEQCSVPGEAVVRNRVWLDPQRQPSGAAEPLPYEVRLSRLATDDLRATMPGGHRAIRPATLRAKRCIDAVLATLALVALSPLLLLVAIAVKLESRGSIFYGDEREGTGGRVFRCWKFRTMRMGAHAIQSELKALDRMDGPHFKVDGDPRVTRVGRILRALNIDELPQLFNVLVGDMSLVGPRPSPFRENQICVPWREARLSVRPGITGFWQVCRHDRAAGDFHQWIEYDLLYVRHLSLMLDARILLATVLTLGGKARHVSPSWLLPSLAENQSHELPAATRARPQPASQVQTT